LIISKTPFRISFFGGGTDFPIWFREHEGAVLSTSIDKYCYISLRKLPPFFHHKFRLVYTDTELVTELSEIRHPSARECLKFLRITDGLEIHHDGDLPSRSGLGSSSSFTVGLLHALKALQGQIISHRQLADLAILIERDIIGESGGLQDQIAVAHGGFNHISFRDGGYSVTPLILRPQLRKELETSLCLFYAGKSRIAEEIEAKKMRMANEHRKSYQAIYDLTQEGLKLLQNPNFLASDFGKLLHENWLLKKTLAHEVSNPDLDEIYDKGMRHGAHGGKLLGAGGGGFFLFCVDSYHRDVFVSKMSEFLHVPFKFEYGGSQIALYDPS
jgi:D-glycero-alpha-D-manno-heptose-7-phosphate kinase